MITGEHAVLHGAHALVGALNTRLHVRLRPRHDRAVTIQSALGQRNMTLDALDTSAPFTFVTHAIQRYACQCPSGFDLEISTAMRADTGLGSSSAVTVAALVALHMFAHQTPPESAHQLHAIALNIVRGLQGAASGADLAAAVWGGVLLYRQTPQILARHKAFPAISLAYAGYKTPTADVIKQVESRRLQNPDAYRQLFSQIDACSLTASKAFTSSNWNALASSLNQGQSLMDALGVCDDTLSDIVNSFRNQPDILAAKISGSGMGDCVLAIGKVATESFSYPLIPVQLSTQGVMLESQCLFA
jgi:mevalonate kinase